MAAYDPATALVVVDVQNDFADPAGGLYVPGAEAVIPAVNAEVAAARSAGAQVVYTTDWHPPRTPHFASDGGPWPVHCVKGTWGAELHPQLTVDGDIVRKGTGGEDGYSGFGMRDPRSGEERTTGLAALLRARGVSRVVVVGLAGDVCVAATATDAARLGFATTVVRAATASVEVQPGDEERAFAAMAAAGVQVV
ncbi:MAG: isochorismatase family protein [Acidimicrobiia bacterium]